MNEREDENGARWADCVRYLAGEMAEHDGHAFEARVRNDAQLAAELEKARRLWDLSGGLTSGWDADRAIVRLKRAAVAPTLPPRTVAGDRRWRHRVTAVMAAAAILTIAVLWRPAQRSTRGASDSTAPATTPAIADAGAPVTPTTFVAPAGERRVIRLVDGTEVRLASGSTLIASSGYGRTDRRVWLSGVAHFAVASQPSLPPLLVLTEDAVTRDISTRFLVKRAADDRATEVVVTEGVVVVSRREPKDSLAARDLELPSRDEVALRLDEVGTVTRDGVVVRKPNDDPRRDGWSEGRLHFVDTPLADVIAEIGTWYGPRLTIDRAALGALRISGDFDEASIDQIAEMLTASIDARLERSADRLHIRPRGSTP